MDDGDLIQYLLILLFIASLLGLITGAIAKGKGHDFGTWWFFGTLLFIIALPMAIMLKENENCSKCLYCGKRLKPREGRCPECRRSQPSVHWGGKTSTSNWEKARQSEDEVEKWARNQEKSDGNN